MKATYSKSTGKLELITYDTNKDGKVTGLRVHVLADHGAFDACADPSKWPAGFFNIVTGSYDFPTAHLSVDGIYTNKAPGGVAYRCSFRITEAVYLVERMVDALALEMKADPIELRIRNEPDVRDASVTVRSAWTQGSDGSPLDRSRAVGVSTATMGTPAARAVAIARCGLSGSSVTRPPKRTTSATLRAATLIAAGQPGNLQLRLVDPATGQRIDLSMLEAMLATDDYTHYAVDRVYDIYPQRGRIWLEYDDPELGPDRWIPARVELERNDLDRKSVV